MTFLSTLHNRNLKERLKEAASRGQLEEIINLSAECDKELLGAALINSCVEGHLNVVKWLVEHTAVDVNYKDKYTTMAVTWKNNCTPLIAACERGHLDIVKYLVLTCEASVNELDNDGDSPITTACFCVNAPVLIFLLNEVNGLDLNVTDSRGNTALHYTIWCVKNDCTELHLACYTGNVTKVQQLVLKADVNLQDNIGSTPLHAACYNGHSEVVMTMMLAGANETITNDSKETPADVAVSWKNDELVKFLDRKCLFEYMARRKITKRLSVTYLIMTVTKAVKQNNDVFYQLLAS